MYISFTKYVSSVPGVTYKGYDGLKEIYDNNNRTGNGSLMVPADHYDRTIYGNFLEAMTEFKSKPNGIVSYLARTNDVDITYTVTLFSSMEDFLSIAQTNWFEDYSAKRAAYLSLVGIQTYLKNVEQLPYDVTISSTFDDLHSQWDQLEVIIA
jgi:hypothetical protein